MTRGTLAISNYTQCIFPDQRRSSKNEEMRCCNLTNDLNFIKSLINFK